MRQSPGEESPREDEPPAAPELVEALRQIGMTGKASISAMGDTARTLRSLLAADVSLARSAAGRTLAMSGVAIVCGGTAWLFLMGALVVLLNGVVGLSWPLALLIPAALSVIATCLATWQAVRYFEHTRMDATRRQLARFGIGELSDLMPSQDSAYSARDAANNKPMREPADPPANSPRSSESTA